MIILCHLKNLELLINSILLEFFLNVTNSPILVVKLVVMQKLKFVVVIVVLSLNLNARTYTESEYQYPFKDPWVASISSGAFLYEGNDYEKQSLEFLPERRTVPLLEKRNLFLFNLLPQKDKKAPLVFIISGTGGSAFSDRALWIGKQLFAQGYHVVTLPNTLSFQYALSVSRSGAPGYMPIDAKEYFDVLVNIEDYLIHQKKLQIEGYSIIGYSLGGLLAGFIHQVDLEQRKFNFNRIVLLNPAVDVGYSIGNLDEFYSAGDQTSEERKQNIISRVFSIGMDLIENGFSIDKILSGVRKLNLNLNEKKWIVGRNFRSDLRDLVYVSQQINDLNVLKSTVSRWSKDGRLNEAFKINFNKYVHDIVVPSLKRNDMPLKEFLWQASLYPLIESLKVNPNVYIFANADDFIYRPEDIEVMRNLVGDDRFYFYPYGGHVGNFWYPQNKADLDTVMAFR